MQPKQDRWKAQNNESFPDKTAKKQRQKENLKNRQREKMRYF